jgi:hypothetical protein
MKNTLSENMMRFGTKNLSESAQKELVLKSIMETINQHGLSNVIRKKLTELWDKKMGDPSWLLYPAGQYQSQFGGDGMTMKYKPGATYVQQMSAAAHNSDSSVGLFIMPKGTKWTISPSGFFMLASCMQVTSNNFGYGVNAGNVTPMIRGLQDPNYLGNVAMGKAKGTDGQPVTVSKSYCATSPHSASEEALVPNADTGVRMIWPTTRLLSAALEKLKA